MQKLLTIVVPVYKVEPYIHKCLDSCLIHKIDLSGNMVLDEKLMDQFEVIIVNDGTPDNSAEMSREYVKRYPNTFRQIDKENGGHGSAWNVGLKEATGKYLRFLDSDDWLVNLDKFLKKLSECDADLVFTQMDKYYVERNEYIRNPINGTQNRIIKIEDFPYMETNDISICNFQYCTYKTNLLQPFWPLFHERTFYDDVILFVLPQIVAKTCIVFDFPLYQYLIGRKEQTVSNDVRVKNFDFQFNEFYYAYSFSKNFFVSKNVDQWLSYIYTNFILIVIIPFLLYLDFFKARRMFYKTRKILFYNPPMCRTKQINRYLKWPFLFYYVYEKIRSKKNSFKNKLFRECLQKI